MLLGFVSIPVMIKTLGKDSYGLWVLASTILGYFAVIVSGIPGGVVKFIAENKKDVDVQKQILSSAVLSYLMLGVICAIALFSTSNIIASFFMKKDPAYLAYLLRISSVCILVLWPLQVFSAAFIGQADYFSLNFINGIFSVINTGALIVIVLLVGRLDLLLITNYAALIIGAFVIYHSFKRKYLGNQPLSHKSVNFKTFKSVTSFTVNMTYLEILSLIALQADTLIIGYFMTVADVTYYSVITKFVYIFRSFFYGSLISAVSPMIYEANKSGNVENLLNLVRKGTKYTLLVLQPIVVYLIIAPKLLLSVWVGPDFGRYSSWAALFATQFLFSPMTAMIGTIVIGLGKLRPLQIANTIIILSNFAISVLMVKYLGIGGPIFGTAFTQFVSFPIMYYLYCKYSGISWRYLLKDNAPFLITMSAVTIVLYLFVNAFLVVSVRAFLGFSIIYFVAFYSVIYRYFVETDEKLKIKQYINKYLIGLGLRK